MKHILNQFIATWIVLGLVYSPATFARQMTLNKNMNFHFSNGGTLKKQDTLPAGTVVEIPDEYLKQNNMENASEASLVNWLRRGTDLFEFTNSRGEKKNDFFTPVRIVSTPDKTIELSKDKNYYVALKYLAEREDGISFVTTDTISAYTMETKHPVAPKAEIPKPNTSKTEAECDSCYIKDPTPTTGSALAKLKILTNDLLEKVDSTSDYYISTKNNIGAIKANFESSCKGVSFEDYKDFLEVESKKAHIPTEIMLGIMTQESSGLCLPVDSNGNYGLFQINKPSGSTKKSICTEEQRSIIATASLSKMKTDASIQCLENPVLNAKEGIRILIEKYRSSNKKSPPNSDVAWSKRSISDRDDWRRATAGYNGGQGHVNRATTDMKAFRDKYASDLDVNSFELQQIFFFREVLKHNGYVPNHASARSDRITMKNLAYTRAITGNDSGNQKDTHSFISLWEQDLYPTNSAVQVAKEH